MNSHEISRESEKRVELFVNVLDSLKITCEEPYDVKVGGPGLLDTEHFRFLLKLHGVD